MARAATPAYAGADWPGLLHSCLTGVATPADPKGLSYASLRGTEHGVGGFAMWRWKQLLAAMNNRTQLTPSQRVWLMVLLSSFMAIAFALALVGDWASGVSHSDASFVVPLIFMEIKGTTNDA